jgi:hypothetical protein
VYPEAERTVEDILESLPNQVLPDVTVDLATKTDSVNQYTVTFVSAANSGDVNPLVCKTDGCNIDGCQPRYTGVLKKVSRTYAGATAYSLAFFGDNSASQDIVVDSASNAVTVNAGGRIIEFATSPLTKTKTPVVGATVTFGSVTTTLVHLNLAGLQFTFASDTGVSSMSSGTLTMSFSNPANTVSVTGVFVSDMAQAVGAASASAAQSIEIVVSSGVSKLVVGGTTTGGIDLTKHIHVGDTLKSATAFLDTADAGSTLLVTSVTALEVGLTGGGGTNGAVLTAKAAVTTGALNLIEINKLSNTC